MAEETKLVNKVVLATGEVLIDLTSDTVEASQVLIGSTFHDKSGAVKMGSCPYDADTSDDNVSAGEVLFNKTCHARGAKIIGTMPNRGKVTYDISSKTDKYIIPAGYHDGSGFVQISSADQAKLIATNIRDGVTILGVLGTMSGSEGMNPESMRVIRPEFVSREHTPLAPHNCFTSVYVQAIDVQYTDNSAGGQTCTIGWNND